MYGNGYNYGYELMLGFGVFLIGQYKLLPPSNITVKSVMHKESAALNLMWPNEIYVVCCNIS